MYIVYVEKIQVTFQRLAQERKIVMFKAQWFQPHLPPPPLTAHVLNKCIFLFISTSIEKSDELHLARGRRPFS